MFGTTLVARVPRFWQLSLVPRPLDLSSYIFNTRVLGTRCWIIQQSDATHVTHSPKFCTLQPLLVPGIFIFSSDAIHVVPWATFACRAKFLCC